MIQINIRKIDLADLDMLQQISRETFQETFEASNSPENMSAYIREKLSLEQLAAELSDPDSSFYFAEFGASVVGYLKINTGKAQSEQISATSIEIERIYARAEYHGMGVGQQLLDFAIDLAHDRNAGQIWLGVWEHNLRAIAFYRKNGFNAFDQHVFWLGDDEQTDILMRREIRG